MKTTIVKSLLTIVLLLGSISAFAATQSCCGGESKMCCKEHQKCCD